MSRAIAISVSLCLLSSLGGQAPKAADKAYRQTIETWRKNAEASLKVEGGWLTVAGLYWLEEGTAPFKLDASGALVLPAKSAKESLGAFTRAGNNVSLQAFGGKKLKVSGKDVQAAMLVSDVKGNPDRITLGSLTMTVIQRGKRVGIRVYDKNSKALREFTGMKWYPVDPAYRIKAKYVAYPKTKTLSITNVLGDRSDVPNPGFVEFAIGGKTCRLEAQDSGAGLFFNFRDLTSGKTTYPAGRFLDAPKPVGGYVLLDFNQATNPPCAFTDFATCPLPPEGNTLKMEINAGEKKNRGH